MHRVDGWFRRGMGAAVLLAGIVVFPGCTEDVVDPDRVATNILESHFVPRRENTNLVATNPAVPKLDGDRLDIEWGSPDVTTLPWKAIRLDAANGSGSPGPPVFALVKSIYTEKHVYFLLQWSDPTQSDARDIWTYTGPDLGHQVPGNCYPEFIYNARYWTRSNAEDWVSFAFEMEPASDPGGTFAEQGCLVACHGEGFGAPSAGRLDVWAWGATRTNPPFVLVNPTDSPVNPAEGEAGYADDFFADASGLQADGTDAEAGYRDNIRTIDGGPVPGPGPDYVYRRLDGLCDPDNGGLTPKSAFMWEPCTGTSFRLVPCDTLNDAPVDQSQARKWKAGDTAAGYILRRPLGSRADVRAKGKWDDEQQVWTLEISRSLNTLDEARDIRFDLGSKREYRFTLAIADNSKDVHYGSEAQVLRFVPAQ